MIRTIKAGTVRPKDRFRYHLWHNLTFRKSRTWRVRFRLKETVWALNGNRGTYDIVTKGHCKLLGLHDSSLLRWRRVRNGGWRQALSMSHENSDRIVAYWRDGSVILQAYAYRDGYGPAIAPHPDGITLADQLCVVPRVEGTDWTEWVEILIKRSRYRTFYHAVGESGLPVGVITITQTRKPSLFQMQSGAHGSNGPSSPHAESTLVWEVEG